MSKFTSLFFALFSVLFLGLQNLIYAQSGVIEMPNSKGLFKPILVEAFVLKGPLIFNAGVYKLPVGKFGSISGEINGKITKMDIKEESMQAHEGGEISMTHSGIITVKTEDNSELVLDITSYTLTIPAHTEKTFQALEGGKISGTKVYNSGSLRIQSGDPNYAKYTFWHYLTRIEDFSLEGDGNFVINVFRIVQAIDSP